MLEEIRNESVPSLRLRVNCLLPGLFSSVRDSFGPARTHPCLKGLGRSGLGPLGPGESGSVVDRTEFGTGKVGKGTDRTGTGLRVGDGQRDVDRVPRRPRRGRQ